MYTTATSEGAPQTPERARPNGPYYETPTGIEGSPETPGYKGRAFGVGIRQSLPRVAKSEVFLNLFQADDEGPGIGEPTGTGDAGGSLQEGFWSEDAAEGRGERECRTGNRKAVGM